MIYHTLIPDMVGAFCLPRIARIGFNKDNHTLTILLHRLDCSGTVCENVGRNELHFPFMERPLIMPHASDWSMKI